MNFFQLFGMKAVKANVKFKRENKQNPLNTMPFDYFFYKLAYLQEFFHGWVLSILVFSSDGHNGLIVSLVGQTLSRHVIDLNL